MRFHRTLALSTGCLLVGPAIASAQVTTLALEGDNVPGVGNITQFDNIAISSSGDWLAEVRTDDPNNATNKAVLKNGNLYLREGQNMSAPAGATLKKFDALILNINGNTCHNPTITVGGSDMTAVYWNDKLIKLEGDATTAAGFAPGTTFLEFHEVRMNANEQIAALVSVNDSAIAGVDDYAIIMWDTNGNGVVTGETILVKERDAGGTPMIPISGINLSAHIWGFNDSAEFIYNAKLDSGAGAADDVVIFNTTPVVEESYPSPLAGRNWNTVTSPELGLNKFGDWAISAGVAGDATDDQLIVKNNVIVVQEGDSLPDMNGAAIKSFGAGPVEISDAGDVLWFCFTTEADTTKDTSLWVNEELLIQEGVTTVGNNTITGLVGTIDGYHFDHNGQNVIFEGTLDSGLDGVFRVPVAVGEPGAPMCFGDGTGPNCPCANFGGSGQGCLNSTGNGGMLAATGSASIGVSNMSFSASALAGNKPTLLVSNTSQNSVFFGDGVLCIGSAFTHHSVVFSSPAGVANWGPGQLTNTNWTVGQDRYFQALFRDPGGPCGGTFNSSSAYKVTFLP